MPVDDPDAVIQRIREAAGLEHGGPDDDHLLAGVVGFAEAFNYWYIRVIREAVPQYRNLVIKRINPFIRRIELEGLAAEQAAERLVGDYNARIFVTAGGWALEELAVSASMRAQKSGAEGIDAQRFDAKTGDYHLYVIKSGLVTRNSDIVNALKRNARQAEKLLRQGRSTGTIHMNYVVAAGKTTTSFEDGVRRPSSGEFWSEMLDLPEDDAIELALAMAGEAGRLVRSDASEHLAALRLVVADYIASREDDAQVDWVFLAERNMRGGGAWRSRDKDRHGRAMERLAASGYVVGQQESDDIYEVVAELDADGR